MYLRRRAAVKYFIAAYVGAALYCEWFVYLLQPLYWPDLKCQQEGQCTKILFIADPQIQGDLIVPPPLNYIFIWDSDRYVKSTFSVVSKHFKPDVLVYLGDLMDEGSISSMEQFHSYIKRLLDIFEVDFPVVQIWLPGDNDIGGENEPIKADKVEEFEEVFEQQSVIIYNNISFYKVNGITHSFPKRDDWVDDNYNIVVSHYPVTLKHGFGRQVNNEIHPNIYFCAHDHEAKYVKQDKHLNHRQTHWMLSGNQILHVPRNDESLYEIYVPTCSYRMGTKNIGYGAAILENNNQNLRYTVFWSSQRFPYLIFYLVLLIIVLVYLIVYCTSKILTNICTSVTKTTDKVPLLERL